MQHGSYCGYEGTAVDVRAVLGQAGLDGFYLACGFSLMGFRSSPAVGMCLNKTILKGKAETVILPLWG